MASEKIEVRYKDTNIDSAGGGNGSGQTGEPMYHKYLVYTDKDGNVQAARGGTSLYYGGLPSPVAPMGTIVTTHGPYAEGFPDFLEPSEGVHPGEVIVTGPDLSEEWERIKEAMDLINDLNRPYFPGRNSNSAVDTALDHAGLPLPQNDDRGDDYWSPGSDNILPIPQAPEEPNYPPVPQRKPKPPYLGDVDLPFTSGESAGSPLVIDVDGDGIELAALSGPGSVYWDIDQDGFREASGWIAGGDGLLALDRNANDRIDAQNELFGTLDTDGFAALRARSLVKNQVQGGFSETENSRVNSTRTLSFCIVDRAAWKRIRVNRFCGLSARIRGGI